MELNLLRLHFILQSISYHQEKLIIATLEQTRISELSLHGPCPKAQVAEFFCYQAHDMLVLLWRDKHSER